jgi:ABC-2 type transport system permease protein
VLDRREGNLAAVLTGTPAAPVLTATSERLQWWSGIVGVDRRDSGNVAPFGYPKVSTHEVAASGASDAPGRMRTAQGWPGSSCFC